MGILRGTTHKNIGQPFLFRRLVCFESNTSVIFRQSTHTAKTYLALGTHVLKSYFLPTFRASHPKKIDTFPQLLIILKFCKSLKMPLSSILQCFGWMKQTNQNNVKAEVHARIQAMSASLPDCDISVRSHLSSIPPNEIRVIIKRHHNTKTQVYDTLIYPSVVSDEHASLIGKHTLVTKNLVKRPLYHHVGLFKALTKSILTPYLTSTIMQIVYFVTMPITNTTWTL